MTIEEAVKWLKEMRKDIPLPKSAKSQRARNEAIDMAIEAFEKQIPKEPIWEGSGYVYGEMVYDTWQCPKCNSLYDNDELHRYCPCCGQKILWGE